MQLTFHDTSNAGGVLLVDLADRQIALLVELVGGPNGSALEYINAKLTSARYQRNFGNTVMFIGGGVGAASGTLSATTDKDSEKTKNALAILSGVGALVAVAAPLIGNPSGSLAEYKKQHESFLKSQQAVLRLRLLLVVKPTPHIPEVQPVRPQCDTNLPDCAASNSKWLGAQAEWKEVEIRASKEDAAALAEWRSQVTKLQIEATNELANCFEP